MTKSTRRAATTTSHTSDSRIDQEIQKLTEATRRAHEALRDLKVYRKELEEWAQDIRETLAKEVEKQVNELGTKTQEAINTSEFRIQKRFDTCEKLIFEGTKKGDDDSSLETMISQMLSRQTVGALVKRAVRDGAQFSLHEISDNG